MSSVKLELILQTQTFGGRKIEQRVDPLRLSGSGTLRQGPFMMRSKVKREVKRGEEKWLEADQVAQHEAKTRQEQLLYGGVYAVLQRRRKPQPPGRASHPTPDRCTRKARYNRRLNGFRAVQGADRQLYRGPRQLRVLRHATVIPL